MSSPKSIIKYISINGESDIERVPAGQTSVLLLDANVFAYLQKHRKDKTAYPYSQELGRLLKAVHRRQIRVDATLASIERGVTDDMLLPGLAAFTTWFEDFYQGKSLFKVESLKPATGPVGTKANYAAAADHWVDAFLPAYATVLKALELVQLRPKREAFSHNVQDLFTWCDAHDVPMGLAANLVIGLFAQEPSAKALIKYNKCDSVELKLTKAHNAARDIIYFVRLIGLQYNNPAGAALLATADAGLYDLIRLNQINFFKVDGPDAIYSCAVYPELGRLLKPEERALVEQVRNAPVTHSRPNVKFNRLVAAIGDAQRALIRAHGCPDVDGMPTKQLLDPAWRPERRTQLSVS